MGSQLAKTENSQQNSSSSSSRRIARLSQSSSSLLSTPPNSRQPIQSTSSRAVHDSSVANLALSSEDSGTASNIVVVNRGPSVDDQQQQLNAVRLWKLLPPIQRPLIPLGQTTVNQNYPQLLAQPLIDLGLDLESELRLNAERVAREQQKLSEKIREIDQKFSQTSSVYCTEKQRRFNKARDNFDKFDEIELLIGKCEQDIDTLVNILTKLNLALPETFSLEELKLVSL